MMWATISNLADWLSIVGFPLGVIGLIITIWQVKQARTASENASKAVADFRQEMTQLNIIEQFSRTLASLENLKRLARAEQYQVLPEMFAEVRKSLIYIREYRSDLSEVQQQTFQSSITSFKLFEERFEKHLSEKTVPPNIAKIINQISTHTDELHTTLVQIRKQIEDTAHE